MRVNIKWISWQEIDALITRNARNQAAMAEMFHGATWPERSQPLTPAQRLNPLVQLDERLRDE